MMLWTPRLNWAQAMPTAGRRAGEAKSPGEVGLHGVQVTVEQGGERQPEQSPAREEGVVELSGDGQAFGEQGPCREAETEGHVALLAERPGDVVRLTGQPHDGGALHELVGALEVPNAR
jgi:hypothetical protein